MIGPIAFDALDEQHIRESLRHHPLIEDAQAWRRERPFRVAVIEQCTYDGTIYDAQMIALQDPELEIVEIQQLHRLLLACRASLPGYSIAAPAPPPRSLYRFGAAREPACSRQRRGRLPNRGFTLSSRQ